MLFLKWYFLYCQSSCRYSFYLSFWFALNCNMCVLIFQIIEYWDINIVSCLFVNVQKVLLTHWSQSKIVAILPMTLSKIFTSTKIMGEFSWQYQRHPIDCAYSVRSKFEVFFHFHCHSRCVPGMICIWLCYRGTQLYFEWYLPWTVPPGAVFCGGWPKMVALTGV